MVNRQKIATAAVLFLTAVAHGFAAPPRVNDGFRLELIASEPEIVTPIGMAFDREGRLLVVESHTHQRPAVYKGPTGDRIRRWADSDGDGRLDRWSTYAEGFRHAMNLLARGDGAVYLVERGRVLLLRDTDDDGVADAERVLLRLETEDDYPHNALGGIDQAPDGSLILGLGENHGLPFRLIGSDGKEIAGAGGLDGFFRCTADGKNIEHLARGVWNPFSLCVLGDGRIFAVDNDPDSSPPCRLLHVAPGGDYGYLYQYGRAGTHPLQCWNGELPGTLPMVCGTGEAPTAIVAHAGSLWVTSWGDHRIERYRLVSRGSSIGAGREVIVQGDADFRPTGMAVAPDGSLYFGDWVKRDYPVHGRGRIWRLVLPPEDLTKKFADALNESGPVGPSANARLRLFETARFQRRGDVETMLKQALADESADVRLYAVRWIADERITALRDDVAALLEGPQPNARYYLAVLAAIDWLDHEPTIRGRDIADELLVRELKNPQRSAAVHALALRSLSPDHSFLTLDRLREYLEADYVPLRLEAVRSLSQQRNEGRFELLAAVAGDERQPEEIRAEAIMGLAPDAKRHQSLLRQYAGGENRVLRREAERVLRLAALGPMPTETKPPASELAAWGELLSESGDTAGGRRLFFSSVGPRCGVCHQHGGRGGRIGPDLSNIAVGNTREQLLASILQPSQEIAPHYQAWLLVTSDGKTRTGLRLHKAGDDGIEHYVDAEGREFTLKSADIQLREAATTSIMPDGLENTLSIADLRDLVAYLASATAE